MLTLVTTPDCTDALQRIAASAPPAMGGMRFREAAAPDSEDAIDVVLTADGLRLAFDWLDQRAPWAFPTLPCDATGLAAVVALTQYEWERVAELVPSLRHDLVHVQAITEGFVAEAPEPNGATWAACHNRGVLAHYGASDDRDLQRAVAAYRGAIDAAPTPVHAAWTTRQLATLLLDLERADDAAVAMAAVDASVLSPTARHAMAALGLQVALARTDDDTSAPELTQLLELAARVREGNESRRAPLAGALVRLDEATLLRRLDRCSEAIAAAEAARATCAEEGSAELVATCDWRLGELWHAWAHAGVGDAWKKALSAFQEALKVFTAEAAPAAFAQIHHELAVVYALMPAAEPQRPILLALSGGSFELALQHFDAERHPLLHARIRTNYGNAMLRCPESRLRDPVQRAVDEYRRALATGAGHFSADEHALVLLNLLEGLSRLGWPEGDSAAEQARWQELRDVAGQAEALPMSAALQAELAGRIEALEAVAPMVGSA
jgi:tetratricopeptide (TPR) repeat protein